MIERFIGIIQIITGITGVIILLLGIEKGLGTADFIQQIIFGVILYLINLIIGVALILRKEYGLKYAIILQALQTISVSYNGMLYKFTATGFFSFVISNNRRFDFQISTNAIDYAITRIAPTGFQLQIFLVPMVLFGLLLLKRKNILN